MYREITGGLRKPDPQIAGPGWEDLGDPTARGIQVTLVWNIRRSEGAASLLKCSLSLHSNESQHGVEWGRKDL